jgi:hypothetical protein
VEEGTSRPDLQSAAGQVQLLGNCTQSRRLAAARCFDAYHSKQGLYPAPVPQIVSAFLSIHSCVAVYHSYACQDMASLLNLTSHLAPAPRSLPLSLPFSDVTLVVNVNGAYLLLFIVRAHTASHMLQITLSASLPTAASSVHVPTFSASSSQLPPLSLPERPLLVLCQYRCR